MPMKKIDLPLDRYWGEEAWQYFYLKADQRQIILATMRSLGLKAASRHYVHFRFHIENLVSLDKDVNKIAGKLCRKSSAAELISSAADPSYLDKEIDIILDTYTYVWSLDAGRTKILNPGSEPLYPKHLFYEDDEDRKLLWIHLRRWIFIKALKSCKQRDGPSMSSMNNVVDAEIPEDMLDQWHVKGTHVFEDPEESGTASPSGSHAFIPTGKQTLEPAPTSGDDMFADPTLQEHETPLLEALGHYFAEERREQHEQQDNTTTNAAEPDSATQKPSRRRRKRKNSSAAGPEQPKTLQPNKQRRTDQRRTTFPGYDFSTIFMSYLENFADPEFDELAALKSIARELSVVEDHASGLDMKKGVGLISIFFVTTIPAWLVYRREIVEAKREIAAMQPPVESSHCQLAAIERSKLATHFRKAHETFMKAGDGPGPEEVIYSAMITLMNEQGNSQTAQSIRNGFMGMEDEFARLGDQLIKDGGAQFVMGDFAYVARLKGEQPHAWRGQDAI